MLVVGIDVGLEGAVAFYDTDLRDVLGVEDMPVDRMEVAGEDRGFVSDARLLAMLRGSGGGGGGHAFLEEPEGRPIRTRDRRTGATVLKQPSARRMLSLGVSYGVARCACVASGLAVTAVKPGSWKREMGVPGDKDEARRRATELWPAMAERFARKKDDGRAEACLLALYGASRIMRGMLAT